MKKIILTLSLYAFITSFMTPNVASAQGWQAQALNRLIAINGFDNTSAVGGNQLNDIHVGIGTDVPDPILKAEVYSNTQDSHLGIAGVAPGIRFSDNVLWASSFIGQSNLSLATGATDYVVDALAGDFIMQNRKKANLIFAAGGTTGLERMRVDPNGNVGINVASPNHSPAAVWDRFDVFLNPNDYVRIENMPAGTGNPVVIDPVSGRLYENTNPAPTGLFWSLTGNALATNPAWWLGTQDDYRLIVKTNSAENMTIVPQPAGSGDIAGFGNVGINTANAGVGALPSSRYKLQVWSNEDDAHVAISGSAPSLSFSDQLDWNSSTAKADLGLATYCGSFNHWSIPGDFVIQNRNAANSIIFGTNQRTVEGPVGEPGAERVRIDQNGYLGINTINNLANESFTCGATSSGVYDRVDIFLGTTNYTNPGAFGYTPDKDCPRGTQEYVRIQNMPTGTGNIVVIDDSGRLYKAQQTARKPAITPEQVTAMQNAIEELQQEKTKNADLQSQVSELNAKVEQLLNCCASNAASVKTDAAQAQNNDNVLYQNTPNPFSKETAIRYVIGKMTGSASIMISDMNGKELSKLPISQAGEGSVTVQIGNLISGMYLYTLIVDGNAVDTKKMIVNAGQ